LNPLDDTNTEPSATVEVVEVVHAPEGVHHRRVRVVAMRAVPMNVRRGGGPANGPAQAGRLGERPDRQDERASAPAPPGRRRELGPKYAEDAHLEKRCAEWVMRGTGKP